MEHDDEPDRVGRRTAGFNFYNVLAVSPTEIYLGEVLIRPSGLQNLDNIVRLEISALPALAAGAGWPR